MRKGESKPLEREILGKGLAPTPESQDAAVLLALGRALWRNRLRLMLIGFLGGCLGYALTYVLEVRYTSYAQVMIDTRIANDPGFAPAIAGLPTSITALESELEVLRSTDLVQRVADRMNLYEDPEFAPGDDGFALSPRALINAVKGGVRAVLGGGGAEDPVWAEARDREGAIANIADRRSVNQIGNMSAVFMIDFTSNDPQKAADLANALAAEYINSQITDKLRALDRAQSWLADRTRETQRRLASLGIELENHILDAPFTAEDVQTMKASRATIDRRLIDLRAMLADRRAARERIAGLERQNQHLAAAELVTTPSPELSKAIILARAGKGSAAEGLSQELVAELARLDDEIGSLESNIALLEAEGGSIRAELVMQAEHDAETRRIENDIRVSQAIYEDFVSQLSRRTQQDQYLNPDSRIIAFARPSLEPSEPRRAVTAAILAILAGLVGAAAVIGSELVQTRLRTVGDYEAAAGIGVMGLVPRFAAATAPMKAITSGKPGFDPELMKFARKLYFSIVSELQTQPRGVSLRGRKNTETPQTSERKGSLPALRTTRGQTLSGASSMPGEGNSTTMLLLAGACCYAGERVLLVDCDFWASPYGAMEPGDAENFTDVLFNPQRAASLVRQTTIDGLDILPAPRGVTEPTAVILSEEFRLVIDQLRAHYDRIILDTPPVLSRIDTAAVHRLADAVVLVIRWNSTRGGAVASTIKVLKDVGVTPAASVAAWVDLKAARGYGDNVFSYGMARDV